MLRRRHWGPKESCAKCKPTESKTVDRLWFSALHGSSRLSSIPAGLGSPLSYFNSMSLPFHMSPQSTIQGKIGGLAYVIFNLYSLELLATIASSWTLRYKSPIVERLLTYSIQPSKSKHPSITVSEISRCV